MRDFLKKITSHIIISAIVSIILGVVLLIWPDDSAKVILYALAIGLAILGIINVVTYIRTKEFFGSIIMGVIELILAIIFFIFPTQVGSIIAVVIGAFIVIAGVVNVISAVDLKNMQVGSWGWILALNVILVIAGIVVIINPFPSLLVFAQVLGVILICQGVVDVISGISFSRNLKD